MRLTPLDIHNHQFSTRLRGYDSGEVEAFLRLIAEDYETLVRERDVLAHQVDSLESRVEKLQETETTLQETLVTAQALSEDLKKTAVKEAELVLSQAELKGERILDESQRRMARLSDDVREMKLLRTRLAAAIRASIESHLAMLDGLASDAPEEKEARNLEKRVEALVRAPLAEDA